MDNKLRMTPILTVLRIQILILCMIVLALSGITTILLVFSAILN